MTRYFPGVGAAALFAAVLGVVRAAPLRGQNRPEPSAAPRDSAPAAHPRLDSAAVGHRATPLPRVVVNGTRLSEARAEATPVQVDALDFERVPPGPAGAAQALTRLPGISAFDDQGSSVQPTLDVRGFTLSPVVGAAQGVSVFLDGVRINEPDAQELNFDLIPLEAVARAELVRGPVAIFGKNTLAGALNLFTARGAPTPRVEVEGEGGSFGYRGVHAIASGVRGPLDGYLLVRGSDEHGWRDASNARTRMVFTTVGVRGGDADGALSLLYADDRIYEAGSLPESWLRVDRRANYTGGDFFAPRLAHASLRGMRNLFGGQLRGNLFVRHNAIEQFNVNVSDPNTRAFVRNASFGGTAELTVGRSLGPLPLTLTTGAEYARGDVRYRIVREPHDSALLGPGCDPSTGLCEAAHVAQDDAAVYAQGILAAGSRVSLTASARADYVRIPFRDLRAPANDGTSTFSRLSPSVGASYQARDGLRGYVAASNGFRAPAALELACASAMAPCPLPFSLGADPALAPVVVWNYETGVDWSTGATTVEAAIFRTDAANEIVFAAAQTAAGFFRNIPRTRRDGAELSARWRLPAGLRAMGSYAYLAATYRSAVAIASAIDSARATHVGSRFPLSPAHRATAGIGAARLFGGWAVDAELFARGVTSQFLRGDEANAYAPLPSFIATDVRFTVERARVSTTLHVTNVMDRRYVTYGVFAHNPKGPPGGPAPAVAPVERFLTPAPPRALSVTVTLRG